MRALLLFLAPALGVAAAELSPACRQAASALNGDFLNVKEQSSITLKFSGSDGAEKIPVVFGPSTPAPLVALGQYSEGNNAGITDFLMRSARSTAALNTLVNHKSGDTAAQAAYMDCSKELGPPGFFDLVARDFDAPDWAAIATNVHRLFADNRESLTNFLYHWDKHEPVPAMFFLLSGVQQDPPSINNFRAAYNADGAKLAQIIRGEADVICKWDGIISVSQFEREHNSQKFQGFLHRLDEGKPQEAYNWLFTQLLGRDQAAQDNFGSCKKVNGPRVDCIAHKAFNREKDFDRCPTAH
jgi:hypothetical protein